MKKEFLELKLRLPCDGMYLIILKRIALCKKPSKEIIDFSILNHKLGTSLQINKKQIWDLLTFFHDLGMIEIVRNHGVILNYEIDDIKLNNGIRRWKNGNLK
jgi:hypothetical protein